MARQTQAPDIDEATKRELIAKAIGGAQAFLSSMTDEQNVAINHQGSPHLLLAGAGAGKTRCLVGRMIKLVLPKAAGGFGVEPDSIMLVTFTNKAAKEIRERIDPVLTGLQQTGLIPTGSPWCGTFHSISLRILRAQAMVRNAGESFTIYDESDAKHVAKEAHENLGVHKYDLDAFFQSLNTAKAHLLTPEFLVDNYDDDGSTGKLLRDTFSKAFIGLYGEYQKLLAAQNAVDFSDLLNKTTGLLRGDAFLRETWRSHFRHFLVDEVQDIDRAQIAWLHALSNGGRPTDLAELEAKFPRDKSDFGMPGIAINWKRLENDPAPSVLCVGDDDQAIYGFRGSDSKVLKLLESRFPNTFVSFLTLSHRCQPHILDATNALVAANENRYGKSLVAPPDRPAGEKVALIQYPNIEKEVSAIIDSLRARIAEGASPAEMAVLVRTRNIARDFAKKCREAGLPVSEGRSSDLRNAAEIKDVMAFASFLGNDQADVHLRRIINKPSRGMGSTSLQKVARNAKLKNITLMEELRSIMNDRIELPEHAEPYPRAFIEATRNFGRMIVACREDVRTSKDGGEALLRVLRRTGYLDAVYTEALATLGMTVDAIPHYATTPRKMLTWFILQSEMSQSRGITRDRQDEILLQTSTMTHDDLMGSAQLVSKSAGMIANIAVLIEKAEGFETLSQFVEEASLDFSHAENRQGVAVMTMHAAKGLEFDEVYLPFFIQGIMPHKNSETEPGDDLSGGSIEEERRLAYVAMTRARHRCDISFGRVVPGFMPAFHAVRNSDPSQFIEELKASAAPYISDQTVKPGRHIPFGAPFSPPEDAPSSRGKDSLAHSMSERFARSFLQKPPSSTVDDSELLPEKNEAPTCPSP